MTPDLDLDTATAQLADILDAQIDDLVNEILRQVYDRWTDLDEGARLTLGEPMRRSTYGNLRAAMPHLVRPDGTPFQAPLDALEEARVAARAGLPLSDLLSMYQLGHMVVWERALEVAGELAAPEEVRREVLRTASRAMFVYINQVSQAVSEAYQAERELLLHRSSQRRVHLVRDILEGAHVDGSRLGYDLNAGHVALVASGTESGAAVQALAGTVAAPALIIAAGDALTWAWFSLDRPDQVAALAPAGDDLRIGFGDARRGPDGFRLSHRQALAACAVAEQLGSSAEHYDAVALDAIALIDEQAARRFVQRELGPLAADDDRSLKLRATMHAYLRTAHNASATAALLGVNDRTIAYRLRTCEELLGRPVSFRAAELETALRWGRLLGLFALHDESGSR